jgi:hypothetical protein
MKNGFLIPGLMLALVLYPAMFWVSRFRRRGRDRIITGEGNDAREALQQQYTGERNRQPGRYQPARKRGTEAAAAVENVLYPACQF